MVADQNDPSRRPEVPTPPKLPDVESPAAEDVLDGVPPREKIVEQTQPSDEIIAEQPGVDELVDRDR